MNLPFFPDHDNSSFFDLLMKLRPEFASGVHGRSRPIERASESSGRGPALPVPQGTTVLALKYQQGVVMAGDRRATEGFQIADRRIEKVFRIDEHSAMAIAGAAGPCIEMAKANLPMVFQGLVVVPLYAGYDFTREEGRIFKYDITGGRYEESDYHAIGSGGKDARNTMREHFRKNLSEDEAIKLALLALYNAADEDVGTGGPDLVRGIFPTVKTVSAVGITDVPEQRIRGLYDELIANRGKGV